MCTYNVTFEARSCNHCCSGKAMSNYILWVCVCSLRYPVCNAHEPYCHLWSVRLCNIFPYYLIYGMIFEKKKKLCNLKCVLFFSTTFVWNIFHSRKNWARYDQKCKLVFRVKYPSFLSDFNKFLDRIWKNSQIRNFVKNSQIRNFMKNSQIRNFMKNSQIRNLMKNSQIRNLMKNS